MPGIREALLWAVQVGKATVAADPPFRYWAWRSHPSKSSISCLHLHLDDLPFVINHHPKHSLFCLFSPHRPPPAT